MIDKLLSRLQELVLDSVTDHMDFGGVAALGYHVAHEFRRHMYMTHTVIYVASETLVKQLIKPFHFAHIHRRSHVLRLDMECRSNRFAYFVAIIDCLH